MLQFFPTQHDTPIKQRVTPDESLPDESLKDGLSKKTGCGTVRFVPGPRIVGDD
jgi:hypothetical protein